MQNVPNVCRENGVGSYRQQWALCTRNIRFVPKKMNLGNRGLTVLSEWDQEYWPLLSKRGNTDAVCRKDAGGDHRIGAGGCPLETQKLENHQRAIRLYDLRNAGPHHRFNRIGTPCPQLRLRRRSRCVKSHGSEDAEEEMQPLVDSWRAANPHIVQFWYALGNAASEVIEKHNGVRVGKVKVYWRDNRLLIRLPSGRDLCYLSPRFVVNRFGSRGIGYLAASVNGKMSCRRPLRQDRRKLYPEHRPRSAGTRHAESRSGGLPHCVSCTRRVRYGSAHRTGQRGGGLPHHGHPAEVGTGLAVAGGRRGDGVLPEITALPVSTVYLTYRPD